MEESAVHRCRLVRRALCRRGLRIASVCAAALLLVAGCVSTPEPEHVHEPSRLGATIGPFSAAVPGGALPGEWREWKLASGKKPTRYRLVRSAHGTVVLAHAQASASGLSHPLRVDLAHRPLLRWRWKVPALIAAADNTRRRSEDSPARVIVTFEGDVSTLPFDDRLLAQQFKLFTGHELPYATLMYIWENRAAVDTLIANRHTGRIKMIVAESGPAHLGQWRDYTRDVARDYRLAFGEAPPPVRSVAILTDTDNTGATAEAYYGDIGFFAAEEED